jgi:NAD(P)-dependent dehydrogenase (short-subunit alcohol dehydrogenase family)
MVAEVLAKFGRIDILVNCAAQPAGQSKPPALAEVTAEALWADVNVKVMGYVRTAREVAGPMAAQGGGRIINISGLAARSTGSIIGSIRNISVAALTKNLADELGPKGITAVCVHPGLTRTEKTPEVEKRMAALNLVGKLISAEEIAYLVAFLASPKSVAVNGDVIAAGGGTRGAIYY